MKFCNTKRQKVQDDEKVDDPDYLTFPDHPLMARFRHEWIMVRQRRPCVPVFADGKMPRANMQEEEKARLCNLFFRPWSMCADFAQVPHVPHMLQLPLYPVVAVRRRMRAKSKAAAEETTPPRALGWKVDERRRPHHPLHAQSPARQS